MSTKGSFENHYDQYTIESSGSILNEPRSGLSEKFEIKLHHFKQLKLGLLNKELRNDIFYDETVYTGSAGFGLYYFLCAIKQDNSDLLKKALEYINIENLKGKRISFLCGDAGPLALATVISYKLGVKRPSELPDYKALALRLMSLIAVMNESPDELLYGKAGYLYALLFVNKYVNGKEVIPANHIEKVINAILKSGKQLATKLKTECPLMWEWHDKIYLGAAHGLAGILYMLLQARAHVNIIEIRSFIKPTLDWLMKQQFKSGNFPSSFGSASGDKLIQWCHGAPGFVPLCILASQVFDEEKYMKIALQLGDVIWERGLCTKGYSICHGVSGNAYAFIQLYQATKKPMHLYRACCFMEWCAVERTGTELRRPDRPASLFEGIVGRLYLAQELPCPMDSRFPGFVL